MSSEVPLCSIRNLEPILIEICLGTRTKYIFNRKIRPQWQNPYKQICFRWGLPRPSAIIPCLPKFPCAQPENTHPHHKHCASWHCQRHVLEPHLKGTVFQFCNVGSHKHHDLVRITEVVSHDHRQIKSQDHNVCEQKKQISHHFSLLFRADWHKLQHPPCIPLDWKLYNPWKYTWPKA